MTDLLHSGALGLLLKGGIFMWPILILATVAVAVIIERWRGLRMLDTDDDLLREEVVDLLSRDEVEQALEKCDGARGPVAAILSSGLRKFLVMRRLGYDPARIEDGVLKSMEGYGAHVVAALERHLPILATVSSVAPMLGFLGTVQGMIVAFANIVETMGEVNIVEAAASGIQTALLTTCFGLIVGIPAYLFFNYFTSVINRFVLDVETSAAELIETVTLQMTLEKGRSEVLPAPPPELLPSPSKPITRPPAHVNLRRQRLLLEPPTSAAPDIAFILLIFFLVCASTQPDSGRAQDLPRAEDNPEEAQEKENPQVAIGPATLLVNGDPVPDDQLPGKLGSLIDPTAPEADRIVVVESSGDTPYERWIAVTGAIDRAGGIVTLRVEESTTQIVD